MEAKHSIFKKHKLKNTKNVPNTFATSHQRWMCCLQHDSRGFKCKRFLKPIVQTRAGAKINAKNYNYYPILNRYYLILQNLPDVQEIMVTTEVLCDGITYNKDDVLVNYNETKQFCCIEGTVVCKEIVFIVSICKVKEFCLHMNSYIVIKTAELTIVEQNQLQIPWPLISEKQLEYALHIVALSLHDRVK